jgi:hypothetical protein
LQTACQLLSAQRIAEMLASEALQHVAASLNW